MIITIREASIADIRADALCTSTNPRLSLYEGTGGAVREKGGWAIKRACEAILEAELERTGQRELRVGSVHVTTAGTLPATIVIHCVASDAFHRSSKEIIAACVSNALVRAEQRGCDSVAMPVFGTGHAAFRFESAVEAMAMAIFESSVRLDELSIALIDPERLADVRRIFEDAGVGAVGVKNGAAS
jgi:O-acetyl-ADP-ribose deacetylase (regulator of RNase III)